MFFSIYSVVCVDVIVKSVEPQRQADPISRHLYHFMFHVFSKNALPFQPLILIYPKDDSTTAAPTAAASTAAASTTPATAAAILAASRLQSLSEFDERRWRFSNW